MTKAKARSTAVWMGMCETPHGTAFVIDTDELVAQIKLFHTWSESVYPGFAEEHSIKNYATLHDWNGATVKRLEMGAYGIWEKQ